MFEKKKRDEDCCTAKIIAMDFFLFKLVKAKTRSTIGMRITLGRIF